MSRGLSDRQWCTRAPATFRRRGEMTSISGAGKREMPSSFASDRRQSAEPGPQASTAASAAASDESGAPPSE